MASYDEKQNKPTTFRGPQSFVTIKAGNGVNGPVESFTIQKAVLCYYSPVLRAAFTGKFSEAATGRLIWDDVESKIAGIMVDWLYTKKLQTEDGGKFVAVDLLKLWTLAERYLIPDLQNAALEQHHSLFKETVDLDLPQEAYEIAALKECMDYVKDQASGVPEKLKLFVTHSVMRTLHNSLNCRIDKDATTDFLYDTIPMLYEGLAVDFIMCSLANQAATRPLRGGIPMAGIRPFDTVFDLATMKTVYCIV